MLGTLFLPRRRSSADEVADEASSERRDMIRGVEDLPRTTVKEVMVPRIDTVFLPVDAGREEVLQTAITCGHSRIPVYKDTIDDVKGVLYVKDLLRSLVRDETLDLARVIRKPYFVPDSKRIDSLLREFRRRRVHIAVAIDEYGGVSGIVCLEDIIEEIVGNIQDEFDNEREDIVAMGDDVWLCDARAKIQDVNEGIGSSFPAEEFDSLGGFVFDLFGKIPARNERTSWAGWDFLIYEMDGQSITSVKLIRRPTEHEEP
ncbi:MAG TPA: hemolysin family protein [Magnetospirillaceae bacterium]|nr:hemolysin family protein [Magnetospirillaceae bacterium]